MNDAFLSLSVRKASFIALAPAWAIKSLHNNDKWVGKAYPRRVARA
jgi:hypothetical protein